MMNRKEKIQSRGLKKTAIYRAFTAYEVSHSQILKQQTNAKCRGNMLRAGQKWGNKRSGERT